MATLLLHLGVTVAMADGNLSNDEERWLERQIEVALKMAEGERSRLRAHLRWLCVEEPTLSGLGKRLESLSKAQRAQLAQSVIALSGADGYVQAEEIEALRKIYSVLGMPLEQLHVHLHALSLPESKEADGLMTVQERDASETNYRIPKLEDRKPHGFKLDMNKVNAKLSETAVVSAMLTSIFAENDPASTHSPPNSDTSKGIGGLDSRHLKLLMALIDKVEWERSAVEELTSRLELLTDGALEVINEASFDMVGEALWEGDDPLRINVTVAKEMLVCQTTG